MGNRFQGDFIAVCVRARHCIRHGFAAKGDIGRSALGQSDNETTLGCGGLFPAGRTCAGIEIDLHSGGQWFGAGFGARHFFASEQLDVGQSGGRGIGGRHERRAAGIGQAVVAAACDSHIGNVNQLETRRNVVGVRAVFAAGEWFADRGSAWCCANGGQKRASRSGFEGFPTCGTRRYLEKPNSILRNGVRTGGTTARATAAARGSTTAARGSVAARLAPDGIAGGA